MIGKLLELQVLRNLSGRSDFVRWLYAARQAWWDLNIIKAGRYPVYLDYPVVPVPRYGHGRPLHAGLAARLDARRGRYAETLRRFAEFIPDLRTISVPLPAQSTEPYWTSGWAEGMDYVSLYCFPPVLQSRRYIEVGSGNSTKFVRRAIQQHRLPTTILSIDPHPRAEIDAICDEVIRQPVEDVDLTVFDQLEDGDILMIDNSHRSFQNSDVTVTFLDILPRLKPGVMIHIHDIFLPADYPPSWRERYYSEQYLLAVLVLADTTRYDIELPCQFIEHDAELRVEVDDFFRQLNVPGVKGYGSSFWMRVRRG